MEEYSYRTLMVSRAVSKFGEAWLNLTKATQEYGLSMDELRAKDKMDESIKEFILLNQKRIRMVTDKLKEESDD